jgi:hypothetical protein
MSSQSARLPDFVIIGAMKGGTSSLHRYLDAHPGVFVPRVKELNFFVDTYAGPVPLDPPESANWRRGIAWYRHWFADAAPSQVAGEASPNYTKSPEYPGVAARIAQVVPRARLVYLVRDPIERIRSHYLHDLAVGRERRPIAEAVRADPRYLSATRYAAQLREYREHFPPDAVLVVLSEELLHDRAATVGRALEHIGADASNLPHSIDQIAHRSAGKRQPSRAAVRLGRLPGRRLVPRALRDVVRGAITRPILPAEAEVDAELRRWLLDELEDDLATLRATLGARLDMWPSVAARTPTR